MKIYERRKRGARRIALSTIWPRVAPGTISTIFAVGGPVLNMTA